ncbi:MAG: glycosyltransferase family 2 protein [Bacteroidales bacterium]|nr:glycosyltransferase family 2 protein [Bacteroidales bacterium]
MKTAVVILNYNTRNYLRQFLPALIRSVEDMDAEVIVADNASSDGSVQMMKEEFPQVRLLEFSANYGFTGGYNRAFDGLQADYYVLINSDIEVPRGWLEPLVEWMDSHPECGACGPKLISWNDRTSFEYAGAAGGYIDRYGYPFCRGRILQKLEKDNGQYDKAENVLWCSGACLLVRRGVWDEIGGLDERFFAHMEEIDLCWRMQLRGWKVTNIPLSEVYHIGGGTLPNESPFKLRLNFRNNLLLLENNLPSTFKAQGSKHPECRAKRRILVRMILDGCSAVVYLLKGKWSFFRAVIQGHREYRNLRIPGPVTDSPSVPEGLYKGWIVPKGLF